MKRCEWSTGSELYMEYHDTEWGVPVFDDQKHFEFLVLESAQAGLSWITILKKREFKFLGSVIMYSHLQATGIINDHLMDCFRYKECRVAL